MSSNGGRGVDTLAAINYSMKLRVEYGQSGIKLNIPFLAFRSVENGGLELPLAKQLVERLGATDQQTYKEMSGHA